MNGCGHYWINVTSPDNPEGYKREVCSRCGQRRVNACGVWEEGEERMEAIGPNGPTGDHYPKQARYQDAKGDDWIDEFARTATAAEFRGAMRFTIGKYNRRAGKKDELTSEIRKMRDYCDRWLAYEEGQS